MNDYSVIAGFLALVSLAGFCLQRGKWLGWLLVLLSAAVLWLLTGCTTIAYDQKPPSDWPQLKVVSHKVNFFQMQEKCGISLVNTVLVGYFCTEWAEPDFCTLTCSVWGMGGEPSRHEEDHCRGYDHPGVSTMKDAWENYKQGKRNYECRFRLGQERYCKLHRDSEICG